MGWSLRAARLDNTLDAEFRILARVDLLILDDFSLKAVDLTETNDFYALVIEGPPTGNTAPARAIVDTRGQTR